MKRMNRFPPSRNIGKNLRQLIHLILSNLQEPESLIKIFIGQCLDCRRFSRASCSGQQYVVGFLTLYNTQAYWQSASLSDSGTPPDLPYECIVIFHSDKSFSRSIETWETWRESHTPADDSTLPDSPPIPHP